MPRFLLLAIDRCLKSYISSCNGTAECFSLEPALHFPDVLVNYIYINVNICCYEKTTL